MAKVAKVHTYHVATEEDMSALGVQLASQLDSPCVMTLSGELGAGKSVLARSVIRGLGHEGAVKSPTYTLVETYETASRKIAHLDLYRLNDPEELHYLGFDDIVVNSDLLIIEWPDKGEGLLPNVTLAVTIEYAESGRCVTVDSAPVM